MGGQLGTGISFANRYPEIWEEILTGKQGQIIAGRDQFNFLTLHLNPTTLPCRKDSSKKCECSAIILLSHQQEVPYLGWQAPLRYFPWQLYTILLFCGLPILWFLVSFQYKNKEHQQQLLAQEKRFRLLCEHAPMPYQSLDRAGLFLEINSSWLEILGYQRDEVIGHSFTDFLLPEGQVSFRENFPRFIKEGETQGIEFQLRKKDGSTILATFNGRVSRDEQGRFIQTHCIFHDISEQRRDQERISHLSLLRKTGIAIHRQLAIHQGSQQLLEAICNIFVDEKGYRSAWVVLLDENQHCKQTANAGLLKDFKLLKQEIEQGNMPACITQTINEGKLLWQDNQDSLCGGCPLAKGYRDTGLMAAPLLHGEQFYGVLTVSLAAEMVTNSEERELFEEMTKDIAFALYNRAQDKKRQDHEQELAIRDQISRTFIIHQGNNLYGGVLDIVLSAMKSKLGVFGFLDDPETLICPSMPTLVGNQLQQSEKTIVFPREKWSSIWKEVLTTGLTQYANYSVTALEGHLAFDNSIASAIVYDGQVIGLLQVANKEEGFAEKDKSLLDSIAVTVAPILQARIDQQRAETELKNALDEYADLYNNAPDMFVSVEAGTAKVLQCNQTLLTTLGYERDEVIGQPIFQLYHPNCRDECEKEVFPTFCKTGIISNKELQLQCKDGSSLPVTLDVSAIRDKDNTIIQSRSIFHDISGRKKLEEQMLISGKMTTIAGLAAGVAHEINTPLSGILQSIQLIEMGLDPTEEQNRVLAADFGIDLAKVQAYLQKKELDFFLNGIRDSATTAAHIVADLLQFSRPQDSIPVKVSLTELVDRSIELAKADYSLKKEYNIMNVEFIREYSPEQPEVHCMAMEIEQVLINLIKNSCQAMAADNSLTAPHITLRTKQRDQKAVIEVEDNGPGMDEEISRKIFDPFFTTKDVGKGTGLGLSVAYSIIEDKHGGTIRVENTPGEGTLFIIELPMEKTKDSTNG